MPQLDFNERVAAQLETFYRGRDVTRRRTLSSSALDAQAGDDVLDVGCGPGFDLLHALDAVGSAGTVTGVEMAPAMLAIAKQRTTGRHNVRLLEGSATQLPLHDGSMDRALSVQVLEYVPDVARALAELHRVVRPGGRVVVWATDWTTLSWHSSDDDRMRRMTTAWDRHLAHPSLPRTLAAQLGAAGFADVRRDAHAFETTALDPEAFGGAGVAIVANYLATLTDIDQQDVDAWSNDLKHLAVNGAYSYAITQFCFTSTRPQ
jgi:arsenite methyltransferase